MKTFSRLAAALLLSCSLSHCAYAATPLVDAQMTGANNQVKSGATLTIKSGASLVIEGGGTISGTQASNANLTALAAQTSAADKLFYFTGSGAGNLVTLTAFSRTLLPLTARDSWFDAIAPASPSANNLIYFNSVSGHWEKLSLGSSMQVSSGVLDALTPPFDATYITRTPSSTLTGEFAMSTLGTGIVMNTTGTGTPSIAVAGTDYLAPSAIGTTVEAYFGNSAGLLTALGDATGTGAAVFGTSPTFTTQITVPKIVYSGSVTESTGTGSPEGVVTASVGSLFHRTDGSTGTTLYIKESGTGNTGWTAVAAGGSGSGTVNTGTSNQLAYYASGGTAVSGLATANNGVCVTNGSGVPIISGTLPALNTGTLTWSGGGNISGSSGAMTIAAAGSNQNIALTPSGLGGVRITINSVITDAVTQSPLIVKNTNTGTSGHASVVIDKGSDPMAALFGFLSAGVSKWDAGLLDDNNFTIRDTVNNRKIFKITTGAPANSLLIGSSGALQLAGYGTGVLTTDSGGNVAAASTVAVSGAISTSSTTASTSTTTGSGIFGGGVGVAGAVYAGGMIVSNQAAASGVGSIRMNSSSPRLQWLRTGGTANQGLWDMENGGDGTFNFRALNDADSSATNIWSVVRSGTTISSQTFAGSLRFSSYGTGILTSDSGGNVAAASTVAVSGAISTSSTTASSSTTTGSGIFAGGVGIAGALNVGQSMTVGAGTGVHGMIGNGGTGTDDGAYFGVQAGGSTKLLVGNYSGIFGGSHNDQAVLYSSSGNSWRVVVNGGTDAAVFSSAAAVRFNAYGAGTLTTDAFGNITASSDERLKDIQGNYTAGLAELRGVQPITYRWKASTGLDQAETYSGFSAQNVLTNLPDAVDMGMDGKYTLQDRAILAALVNAVNQLRAQNELLAALVKDLANAPADKARAQAVLTVLQTVDTADKAARAAAKDAALQQRTAARLAAQLASAQAQKN